MTDKEIIDLIRCLKNGKGSESEVGKWVDTLNAAIPCPDISDLIFFGDDEDTPEVILEKARKYRSLCL